MLGQVSSKHATLKSLLPEGGLRCWSMLEVQCISRKLTSPT